MFRRLIRLAAGERAEPMLDLSDCDLATTEGFAHALDRLDRHVNEVDAQERQHRELARSRRRHTIGCLEGLLDAVEQPEGLGMRRQAYDVAAHIGLGRIVRPPTIEQLADRLMRTAETSLQELRLIAQRLERLFGRLDGTLERTADLRDAAARSLAALQRGTTDRADRTLPAAADGDGQPIAGALRRIGNESETFVAARQVDYFAGVERQLLGVEQHLTYQRMLIQQQVLSLQRFLREAHVDFTTLRTGVRSLAAALDAGNKSQEVAEATAAVRRGIDAMVATLSERMKHDGVGTDFDGVSDALPTFARELRSRRRSPAAH